MAREPAVKEPRGVLFPVVLICMRVSVLCRHSHFCTAHVGKRLYSYVNIKSECVVNSFEGFA